MRLVTIGNSWAEHYRSTYCSLLIFAQTKSHGASLVAVI